MSIRGGSVMELLSLLLPRGVRVLCRYSTRNFIPSCTIFDLQMSENPHTQCNHPCYKNRYLQCHCLFVVVVVVGVRNVVSGDRHETKNRGVITP